MIKDYKIYFVRFSDDTCKHIAAVNMEHALLTANTWIDAHYSGDYDIDVKSIYVVQEISSLIIYKS